MGFRLPRIEADRLRAASSSMAGASRRPRLPMQRPRRGGRNLGLGGGIWRWMWWSINGQWQTRAPKPRAVISSWILPTRPGTRRSRVRTRVALEVGANELGRDSEAISSDRRNCGELFASSASLARSGCRWLALEENGAGRRDISSSGAAELFINASVRHATGIRVLGDGPVASQLKVVVPRYDDGLIADPWRRVSRWRTCPHRGWCRVP